MPQLLSLHLLDAVIIANLISNWQLLSMVQRSQRLDTQPVQSTIVGSTPECSAFSKMNRTRRRRRRKIYSSMAANKADRMDPKHKARASSLRGSRHDCHAFRSSLTHVSFVICCLNSHLLQISIRNKSQIHLGQQRSLKASYKNLLGSNTFKSAMICTQCSSTTSSDRRNPSCDIYTLQDAGPDKLSQQLA